MTTIYTDKKDLPKRKDNDLYPTEMDLVRKALDQISFYGIYNILDIGAGDGRWGRQAKKFALGLCSGDSPRPVELTGVDLRGDPPEGFDHWVNGDYLDYIPHKSFDLVVSNPPYYIAEKIIRKAWYELNANGVMVMLLRLSFQSGVDRYNRLWEEIPPYKVGVVSRRPSFYDRGTNGTDYGIYYWYKNSAAHNPRMWKTFLLLHERDPLEKQEMIAKQLSLFKEEE